MDYTTDLIEHSPDDEDGQQLCNQIRAHLTYLSTHGLDNFLLVPIQNDGRTVSVIIAARGERPGTEEGQKAFTELTGLDSPFDLFKEKQSE